jgi:hypothetical protein
MGNCLRKGSCDCRAIDSRGNSELDNWWTLAVFRTRFLHVTNITTEGPAGSRNNALARLLVCLVLVFVVNASSIFLLG